MKATYTIGTSTIPGEIILPKILPKLIQQNPGVTIKLLVTNSRTTFDSVRNGDIEVGIIGTRYDADEIEYHTAIQGDRLVIIAPKSHPLAAMDQLSQDDLKGQAFVSREAGSGTRATYEQAFRSAGISQDDLNVVAEISDTEGVIQAVAAGTGLSVVSEVAARTSECCGDIVILNFPLEITRSFYIITRKAPAPSQATEEIIRILIDAMRQPQV